MTKRRYGLSKRSIHKNAREFLDMDYLGKLSADELDWMDRFCREYYNHDLTHEDHVHPPTFKLRLHAQENCRQRDVWNMRFRVDLSTELLVDTNPLPDKADGKDK